jgi:hypothetical protein
MSIARPKVFWPLTVTTANRAVKVNDGGGSVTVNIATGVYLSADLLAAALESALNAALPGATVSVTDILTTSGVAGLFKIHWDAPFTLEFSGPIANSAAGLLGFASVNQVTTNNAALYSVLNPYGVISNGQHINGWYSDVAPAKDSLPIRNAEMNTVTRSVSGQTKFLSEVEVVERAIKFQFLSAAKTYSVFNQTSALTNQALENWWANGFARFRYWPDSTVEGTANDYVLDLETRRSFQPTRQFTQTGLYEIELKFWGYVA